MVMKATIVPFLGILFVGAAALVIATTVVLALIPIYIQRNSVATGSTTGKDLAFYVQYSSDLDTDDDSATGNITNTDEIAQSLGVGKQVQILGGQAQTSFERRRRDTSQRRHKRGVKLNILLQCAPLAGPTCFAQSCLQRTRNQAILVMQQASSLTSIPFSIAIGGVSRRLSLRLVYIGVVLLRPDIGFAGEVPSLVFVAKQSGPFTNITTWENGTMPYGNCSIIIPAGVTVTLARPFFELRMRQCDIFGTLIVSGSNSSEFRLAFPSAIVVHSGGNLIDATTSKQILLPSNSLLMVHPNGSVGSSGTTLQIYTRSGSSIQSRSSTVTIPSSGPHTCGILRSGEVITENKIVFIATGVGSILRGSTFLGGVGPSAALCDTVGPCGLRIQPNALVQTDELDDDFNINFDVINILSSGTFAIGKPGSSKGIKFRHRFRMISAGLLKFDGAGGNILLAVGSEWAFVAGGAFRALVAVAMQTYNSVTGVILSTISLGFSFFGPVVYTISSNGQIIQNITSSTPMPTGAGGLG